MVSRQTNFVSWSTSVAGERPSATSEDVDPLRERVHLLTNASNKRKTLNTFHWRHQRYRFSICSERNLMNYKRIFIWWLLLFSSAINSSARAPHLKWVRPDGADKITEENTIRKEKKTISIRNVIVRRQNVIYRRNIGRELKLQSEWFRDEKASIAAKWETHKMEPHSKWEKHVTVQWSRGHRTMDIQHEEEYETIE